MNRHRCDCRTGPVCVVLAFCALVLPAVPARAQVFVFADGFEGGDTSAWPVVVGLAPKTFRVSDLDLRDPHVFVDAGIFGCIDFTDDPIPVINFSFNQSLQDQISGDADGDDFLDLTSLLLFRPLNRQAAGERVDFDDGLCLAPIEDTVCAPDPMAPPLETTYDGMLSGTCLDAVPGTTSGYTPGIDTPDTLCFVTVAETVAFQLGDLTVDLEDVQFAGNFVGTPLVDNLTSGLIRGFLSETAADTLLLPPDLPIVGGEPLSLLLPGGTGNCAAGDDRDVNDSVVGWWFYFNYTADRVTYIGG
jgi:hypothetical protein